MICMPRYLKSQRAVLDGGVEQLLQAVVDGPLPLELLVQVAAEDLDVPRLVHGLGARVVLGVDPRDAAHQLGGDDQRALLAVQELGELERDLGVAQVRASFSFELLEGRVAGQGIDGRGMMSPSGSTWVSQASWVVEFHWSRLAFS